VGRRQSPAENKKAMSTWTGMQAQALQAAIDSSGLVNIAY
jgi:hypothetical protein